MVAGRPPLVRLDLHARSSRFAPASRLARALIAALASDEPRPDWSPDFFVGIAMPAGAGLVLLPHFLQRIGAPDGLIAPSSSPSIRSSSRSLMVSRIPTLSGKRFGRRIPR